MAVEAVLFDLDGVLLSTDGLHYLAWKQMADREGIYFDEVINERLRGVSRMASLEIILERAHRVYSQAEKDALAAFKNDLYKASLDRLGPADVFPGVLPFLGYLRSLGLRLAIGSSSKNTKAILARVELLGGVPRRGLGRHQHHAQQARPRGVPQGGADGARGAGFVPGLRGRVGGHRGRQGRRDARHRAGQRRQPPARRLHRAEHRRARPGTLGRARPVLRVPRGPGRRRPRGARAVTG
ncbi:MAG: HAD hydrolase-like protein [Myxococcales bacterium]